MIGRQPKAFTYAIGLILAGLTIGHGLFGSPPLGVTQEIHLVLAVFVATVILWITKPVPYSISSILCVILIFGFDLVDGFQDAVVGFASTIVIFFILLYLLGTSIAKVNLDAWVAQRLVSATTSPRSSARRLSLAILSLALVMPSGVARTVTFIPVVDQVTEFYGLDENSGFRRFSYYVLGHANPVASLAVMTGSGMAVTTAELINEMVKPISWVEWAVYMIPPVVVLYVSAILIVSKLFTISSESKLPRTGNTNDEDPIGTVEPLTRDQRIVVVVLGLAVCMWIIGSFVGIPAIIPAMIVVFVLALPGIEIVTAKEVGEVSWGIVFLIGAMLSLLTVMEETDTLDLMIDFLLVLVPFGGPTLFSVVMLFVLAMIIRGSFSSSTATIVIILPILLEFGGTIGIDPLFTAFTLMLLYNGTAFLPFNSPTVLIAQDAGPLSTPEIFGLCLITLAVVTVVCVGSWLFYWPMIDVIMGGIF